ncbi:hypothetical protein [Spongiactinospora rosea]|uniref:hypothetical protein n=1 Tax=Spongiactinospora rosea TaxID=2248750 RepID=UPI0011C057AF|nr:hypothetical protein [Spongiactinospora rosea]
MFLVWDVEVADSPRACGVTDSPGTAERAMLDALATRPEGRGRVRYARLSFIGVGYVYGPAVLTAHRKDGATVVRAGDAWENTS